MEKSRKINVILNLYLPSSNFLLKIMRSVLYVIQVYFVGSFSLSEIFFMWTCLTELYSFGKVKVNHIFWNFLKSWLFSAIRLHEMSRLYSWKCRVYYYFSRSLLYLLFSLDAPFITPWRIGCGKFSWAFSSLLIWPTIINHEAFIFIILIFINTIFFLTCFNNFFSITFNEKIFYVIIKESLPLKRILSVCSVMNLTKNIIFENFCIRLFDRVIFDFFHWKFGFRRWLLLILSVKSLKMDRFLLILEIMRVFLFNKLDLIAFNLFW